VLFSAGLIPEAESDRGQFPLLDGERRTRYQETLQTLDDDFRSRHVRPVFALFAGYDSRIGQYDTRGTFQVKFREFAESRAIPLLPSKQVLMSGESQAGGIAKYFQDQCHMNEKGRQKFGRALADVLPAGVDHPSSATTPEYSKLK
jgi:lysophospholipase L1-like esterase